MSTKDKKIERKDLGLSYEVALHGVQSATALAIERRGEALAGASPKHLRVGVDSANISIAAIVDLLVEKGLFTQEEYLEKLRLLANEEVARHEALWDGKVSFR